MISKFALCTEKVPFCSLDLPQHKDPSHQAQSGAKQKCYRQTCFRQLSKCYVRSGADTVYDNSIDAERRSSVICTDLPVLQFRLQRLKQAERDPQH